MQIQGQYYYPKSNKSEMRIAHLDDTNITLYDLRKELKLEQPISQLSIPSHLLGLTVEIEFSDGGRFIPDDDQFKWPFANNKLTLIERLNKNKLLLCLVVALTPFLIWLMLQKAIPTVTLTNDEPAVLIDTIKLPQNTVDGI